MLLLKNIHLKDYQSLFSRVKLDLQADMPEYPTDELVRNHKESRYLICFISNTGGI